MKNSSKGPSTFTWVVWMIIFAAWLISGLFGHVSHDSVAVYLGRWGMMLYAVAVIAGAFASSQSHRKITMLGLTAFMTFYGAAHVHYQETHLWALLFAACVVGLLAQLNDPYYRLGDIDKLPLLALGAAALVQAVAFWAGYDTDLAKGVRWITVALIVGAFAATMFEDMDDPWLVFSITGFAICMWLFLSPYLRYTHRHEWFVLALLTGAVTATRYLPDLLDDIEREYHRIAVRQQANQARMRAMDRPLGTGMEN